MKLKSIAVLASLLVIICYACNKDKLISPPSIPTTETTSVGERDENCRNLSVLCTPNIAPVPHDPTIFARVSTSGNAKWKIQFVEMIANEPTLVAYAETGESYVLTKTKNLYLKAKGNQIDAPLGLKMLLEIPINKLRAGPLEISDFQAIFGNQAVTSNESGHTIFQIDGSGLGSFGSLQRCFCFNCDELYGEIRYPFFFPIHL